MKILAKLNISLRRISWETEVRSRETEVRRRKSEVGRWKLEDRSQKLEDGSWVTEVFCSFGFLPCWQAGVILNILNLKFSNNCYSIP